MTGFDKRQQSGEYTPLEEALVQKERLSARLKEYRERLGQTDSAQERGDLRARITGLRAALKDVQVQIDHLDPPAVRKARKEQRKRLDVGALTWDFFERSGTVWSDLEGRTWKQAEQGTAPAPRVSPEQLQAWLSEASRRLTGRQRLYIDAYYNKGLSMEAIGQACGVTKSTVSRVIRAGLEKLQAWVEAKELITDCADLDTFDWERYLTQGRVLSPRQRQLALLVFSGRPRNQTELGDKLGLDQSTVSRTLTNAGKTLRRLDVPCARPSRRPAVPGWDRGDPLELAQQTGLSLGEYYRLCRDRVGSLTRYRWELYRRMQAGQSAQEAAAELGLSPRTVRRNWSRLRGLERRGELRVSP